MNTNSVGNIMATHHEPTLMTVTPTSSREDQFDAGRAKQQPTSPRVVIQAPKPAAPTARTAPLPLSPGASIVEYRGGGEQAGQVLMISLENQRLTAGQFYGAVPARGKRRYNNECTYPDALGFSLKGSCLVGENGPPLRDAYGEVLTRMRYLKPNIPQAFFDFRLDGNPICKQGEERLVGNLLQHHVYVRRDAIGRLVLVNPEAIETLRGLGFPIDGVLQETSIPQPQGKTHAFVPMTPQQFPETLEREDEIRLGGSQGARLFHSNIVVKGLDAPNGKRQDCERQIYAEYLGLQAMQAIGMPSPPSVLRFSQKQEATVVLLQRVDNSTSLAVSLTGDKMQDERLWALHRPWILPLTLLGDTDFVGMCYANGRVMNAENGVAARGEDAKMVFFDRGAAFDYKAGGNVKFDKPEAYQFTFSDHTSLGHLMMYAMLPASAKILNGWSLTDLAANLRVVQAQTPVMQEAIIRADQQWRALDRSADDLVAQGRAQDFVDIVGKRMEAFLALAERAEDIAAAGNYVALDGSVLSTEGKTTAQLVLDIAGKLLAEREPSLAPGLKAEFNKRHA